MNWFRKVFSRSPRRAPERADHRQAQTKDQRNRNDLERMMVLAGRAEDDPLWKVVLFFADEHARNELLSALGPNLPDGVRQYNAGRAASAEDFASALRDLRVKAQMQAARLKK